MRKLIAVLGFLGLAVTIAVGQDTPQVEVFGGYSHLMVDMTRANTGMDGFHVSVTENLRPWIGGVVDVSAHFNTVSGVKVDTETILFGPQLSYRKRRTVTPSAHVLLGVVRGSVGFLNNSVVGTHFGVGAGGSLDLNVSKNWAVRIAQLDYISSSFQSLRRNNLRFSAGFVLKVGSIKPPAI